MGVVVGTLVVGINCEDIPAGSGGILAQFLRSRQVTDATWKCHNTHVQDWSSVGFDDTTWSEAFVIGKNGGTPWGAVAGISSYADWVWTPNWQGGDPNVWCRKVIIPSAYFIILFLRLIISSSIHNLYSAPIHTNTCSKAL